jgi:hypothetical protein
VVLAIRGAWSLVALIGAMAVLMAVFYDEVLASWARRHAGAREAFAAGGRAGLERASIVPPAFLPVAATMFVVAAMLVWVLAVFFREGHRWGQVGLTAVVAACVFSSVALGFRLGPPPVFVCLTVLSLLVEGVTLICLWHRDTRAYLAGPWIDGLADGSDGDAGRGPDAVPVEGPAEGLADAPVDDPVEQRPDRRA